MDPVYTYSGPGRMVVYERPEGSDRKAPCLPGSRVHLSASELAAYDGQPGVSFAPVDRVGDSEQAKPVPESDDPQVTHSFEGMSKSALWREVKALGLDETFGLSYRESTSDDLIEALTL